MAEIGTAYVTLLPSAKGFGSAVEKEMGGAGTRAGTTASKGFSGTFTKGIGKIAYSLGALFAVDKVKDFLTSAVAEARESQKVSAITAQVIKSTGGAAQVSAKQVGNLATSISNKTGIDDEAIQSGANLLLTFRNIKDEAGKGNDIFDQTTQIMTDMATAMDKDPRGAAIQLGKALNDPTKGITALSRAGVQFDATQTKVIKKMQASGNIVGAQKVILKELNSEFGGTAAASATAGEKMSTAYNNLKEQLGTVLLPIIDKVEGFLSNKVIPAVSLFVTQMGNGKGAGGQFADALSAVWSAAKLLWGILQPIGSFLLDHLPIVYALVGAYVAWQLATLAMNAVSAIQLALLMLQTPGTLLYATASGIAAVATSVWAAAMWLLSTPLGLVVLGILALIVVVILVIKYHKQIGAFIAKVWEGIKHAITKAVGAVIGWIKSHWKLIISILGGPLAAAVILVISHWKQIKGAISDAVSYIRGKIGDLVGVFMSLPSRIASLAGRLLAVGKELGGKVISGLFSGLQATGGLVGDLVSSIKGAINGALNLPFTIKGPGPLPDFTIPAFAKGGRVKGSVVLAGENGWESIIPDAMMVQALTAAASSGQQLQEPRRQSNRLRLVVDGYEFNAYVDDRADAAVASAGALQNERSRASWR
jgi:phage-related protein